MIGALRRSHILLICCVALFFFATALSKIPFMPSNILPTDQTNVDMVRIRNELEVLKLRVDEITGNLENKSSDVEQESRNVFTVRQYTFPSVDERFQYYMGDWFNKTNWSLTKSYCSLIKKATKFQANNDLVYSLSFLESCSTKQNYCKDALDVLRRAKATSNETIAMFHFGDTHSHYDVPLPAVSKSRPAISEYMSVSMMPIIWPLHVHRHYHYVEEYARENEVAWEDKFSKIYWRGESSGHGSRLRLLNQWIQYDNSVVDVAFTKHRGPDERKRFQGNSDFISKHYIREWEEVASMSRYKYLLSVEGNDVASGKADAHNYTSRSKRKGYKLTLSTCAKQVSSGCSYPTLLCSWRLQHTQHMPWKTYSFRLYTTFHLLKISVIYWK